MYKFLRKKIERCLERKLKEDSNTCLNMLWYAKEAIGCALWPTAFCETEYAIKTYLELEDFLDGYKPEEL